MGPAGTKREKGEWSQWGGIRKPYRGSDKKAEREKKREGKGRCREALIMEQEESS